MGNGICIPKWWFLLLGLVGGEAVKMVIWWLFSMGIHTVYMGSIVCKKNRALGKHDKNWTHQFVDDFPIPYLFRLLIFRLANRFPTVPTVRGMAFS